MPRILLIEDEPAIADAVAYALSSEGLSVTIAHTIGEARRHCTESDLIILDVGLPDGSGFDFCRDLRKTSLIPVLFLTARSDEIDRVVGLEIGGDDYVVKPFSPREVAARVRAILRRSQGVPPSGPTLCIDESSLSATWKGTALHLSRYQFRLLAILAAHPGRVFSRSELLDAIWNDPTVTVDRGVDHLIKGLRARLREIDPCAEPIVTHRGDGYALAPGLT